MDKISFMGSNGFLGSNFLKLYPAESIYVRSEINFPQSNIIVYGRSTTSNYCDPSEDIQVNLVKLVEFLKHLTPKHKFVFLSSWFIYGFYNAKGKKTTELDQGRTLGYYSVTKLCAEQLVETYCRVNNIPFQILRLSNIVGPGDNFSAQKNALQFLIEKLKKDEDIELYYNGDFHRSYLHVNDCCKAFKFLIKNGKWGEIYNVGPWQSLLSFREIVEYCAGLLNSKSKITSREPSEFHKIIQPKDFQMDVSKLQNLGFRYDYSFFETLRDICK